MGPLFGRKEAIYFWITGSASRLSFGGTACFTLAVQFCPTMLPGSRPATPGAAGAAGGTMTLLSKFHSGLRGEYRLGLDANLRPFFHREVEPWDILAAHPVSPNEWHELHATYDGSTMRLYVDRRRAPRTCAWVHRTRRARSPPRNTHHVTPTALTHHVNTHHV